MDELIARGIVEEAELSQSVRGRPPRSLSVSSGVGTIVVANVDVAATQLAVADLRGEIIARHLVRMNVDLGPEKHLGAIVDNANKLLDEHERPRSRVRHVVIGLPAPVDFQWGRAVRPPLMPGWDGYPVAEQLRDAFGATVTVDNDVNLMALGVATQEFVETPVIFIKVADGIGAGIVTADGAVHRGADGAAGDIGHIQVSTRHEVVCRCGKLDCLEAVASYNAVLTDLGIDPSLSEDPLHSSRELARMVADSDAKALFRVRQAASDIGEVVAMLIHAINPRTLVLGGPLCELHDEILSGVRATVYERALPLATRKLIITTSQLGPEAGINGAISLGIQAAFDGEEVARLLGAAR